MLTQRLKNVFKLDDSELVSWDDLESLPEMIWIDLLTGQPVDPEADRTMFKKMVNKHAGQLLFMSKLPEGKGYEYHTHDCKESISVVYGSVMVNDKIFLTDNEYYTMHMGTRHKVKGKGNDALLLVEFNRSYGRHI